MSHVRAWAPTPATDWPASRAALASTLRPVHAAAHPRGEFVGQENHMTASEMLALAQRAGVGPRADVIELCCGAGATAVFLADRARCRIVGVDVNRDAIRLARGRAWREGLAHQIRFLVGDACRPPFRGTVDAVLLFETSISIADKPRLVRALARLLRRGGGLALTLDEGRPLSEVERASLPGGERAWAIPEDDFRSLLDSAGFRVLLLEDRTVPHAAVARRQAQAVREHEEAIVRRLGSETYAVILTAHERIAAWLTDRRLRKLALVAERTG